jgi:hypothetical protein
MLRSTLSISVTLVQRPEGLLAFDSPIRLVLANTAIIFRALVGERRSCLESLNHHLNIPGLPRQRWSTVALAYSSPRLLNMPCFRASIHTPFCLLSYDGEEAVR